MVFYKFIPVFVLFFVSFIINNNSFASENLGMHGMPEYKENGKHVKNSSEFKGNYIFYCEKNIKCNSSNDGFDDFGKLAAKGKVTEVNYLSYQPAGTLDVYKNYSEIVASLGGVKINYSAGYEGVHVFMVNGASTQMWIVLENFYNRAYKLTTIEAKRVQPVVSASVLAQSIKQQGYATLHINFESGKADLNSDAQLAVFEVVEMLKAIPQQRISIEGHTDNVGQIAVNNQLSLLRAESVRQALIAARVSANRLQVKGMGSQVPLADNGNETGRYQNRRVELVAIP